jgi:hypothetical protein
MGCGVADPPNANKVFFYKTQLRWYKSPLKRLEIRFFVAYFGQFSCFWIRIRIHVPTTASDPGESNQC